MNIAKKFQFIFENNAIDMLIEQSSTNIEVGTLGGKIWWNVIAEVDNWSLQQNKISGHVRILNPSKIRKAWGTKSSIDEAMDLVIAKIRSNNFAESQTDNSLELRLNKIKLLLEKELITEDEFNSLREKILNDA